MGSSLYCIMLTGAALPARIADYLVYQAAIMFHGRKKRRSIRGACFEGRLWTQFETVLLGSTAGILFKSAVDCEVGSLRVHFMVREAELREIVQGVFDWDAETSDGSPLTQAELRRIAKALEYSLPDSPDVN